MKKLFSLIYCTLIISLLAPLHVLAQNYVWAKGEGGIGNDAANAIAVDDNGNTYITGNLAGMAEFSGLNVQGNGLYDIILAKYDPAGNFLWVKTAGGSGNDQGNALKYKNGYLYMCGFFEDTAVFTTGNLISKGDGDVFTAKFDLDGNNIWTKAGGGTHNDYATGMDVDDEGNVYVAGSYQTTATFDTTGISSSNIFAESFVVKYNSNGQLQWAKSTVGNSTNLITGLAVGYNNIYVTGFFGGNFTVAGNTVSASSPSYDIFLGSLTSDGNCNWLKRAGSTYEDASHAVCVDKQGGVDITGYFAGTAYFGGNSVNYYDYNDIFIARYDTAGNNLWVVSGNGNQLDVGFGLTSDDNGNIFATGMFQNAVDFSGHHINGDERDIFVVSYSKDGAFRWLSTAGGGQTDCGLGVCLKPNGHVAICGYYLYTCSFGNVSIHYANNNDLFVAEFNPPFVSGISTTAFMSDFTVKPSYCNACSELSIKTNSESAKTLQLYNAVGRLVLEEHMGHETVLDVSGIFSGVYFICIIDNLGLHTSKVVIEGH